MIKLPRHLYKQKYLYTRCAKASSWLEGQNWEVVSKQLVGSRHGTETLAARLNTTANRIQLFRVNREQRHVNCDMNVISSVNPQPIKALLDLATTFE